MFKRYSNSFDNYTGINNWFKKVKCGDIKKCFSLYSSTAVYTDISLMMFFKVSAIPSRNVFWDYAETAAE